MSKDALISAGVTAVIVGGAFLIPSDKIDVQTFQDEVVSRTGKPLQLPRDTENIEVHVYESKEGHGWQAIEYGTTTIDGRTYRQWRSFGKGPEADARSFDWRLLDEYAASSTKP